jgi:hypothetical protein
MADFKLAGENLCAVIMARMEDPSIDEKLKAGMVSAGSAIFGLRAHDERDAEAIAKMTYELARIAFRINSGKKTS